MKDETRTIHVYTAGGQTFSGFGSSVDPHTCGEPGHTCLTIKETRQVTPWVQLDRKRIVGRKP